MFDFDLIKEMSITNTAHLGRFGTLLMLCGLHHRAGAKGVLGSPAAAVAADTTYPVPTAVAQILRSATGLGQVHDGVDEMH